MLEGERGVLVGTRESEAACCEESNDTRSTAPRLLPAIHRAEQEHLNTMNAGDARSSEQRRHAKSGNPLCLDILPPEPRRRRETSEICVRTAAQ
jgi:hypothetical protein